MTLGALEALRKAKRPGRVSLALDFNESALSVFSRNFSSLSDDIQHTDITEFFPANLEAELTSFEKQRLAEKKSLDLLFAGPPCQGHSDLNNKSRRHDPRNKLYLSAIRAVKALAPQVAIIENVATVVHDKSNVVERAVEFLKNEYNHVQLTVNSEDFGLAQKRRRHLLILIKIKPNRVYSIKKPKLQSRTLRDVIFDIKRTPTPSNYIFNSSSRVTLENRKRIDYLFKNNVYDLPDSLRPPCHRDKKHSYISMYGRLSWDKPAQTITSGFGSMGQGRYVHPSEPRTLSPHEAARIQGFPDFFDFNSVQKRTELQTCIANAVPPPIIEFLTKQFLENHWIGSHTNS